MPSFKRVMYRGKLVISFKHHVFVCSRTSYVGMHAKAGLKSPSAHFLYNWLLFAAVFHAQPH